MISGFPRYINDIGAVLGYYAEYIVNLLKTKVNLLYIRNQSVPRSKHFPPQL